MLYPKNFCVRQTPLLRIILGHTGTNLSCHGTVTCHSQHAVYQWRRQCYPLSATQHISLCLHFSMHCNFLRPFFPPEQKILPCCYSRRCRHFKNRFKYFPLLGFISFPSTPSCTFCFCSASSYHLTSLHLCDYNVAFPVESGLYDKKLYHYRVFCETFSVN